MLGISAALSGVLLKNGAALAKEPVRRILAKRTLRRRVAKKTVKAVGAGGVVVSRKKLRSWLATSVAADQLATGTSETLDAAVEALRDTGATGRLEREAAGQVLSILLDQFLRESENGDAIASSTNWIASGVAATEARLTVRIDELPERLAVTQSIRGNTGDDLARLHPWRRDKGAEVVSEFPRAAALLHALVAESDRGAMLAEWASNSPVELEQAPSVAWTWLGELASDYGAHEAAGTFFERGVAAGAYPRNYWLARAAVLFNGVDDPKVEQLLADGGDQHPLGRLLLADLASDNNRMLAALASWEPEDRSAANIRAVSHARILVDSDLNAAIAILEDLARDRQASGAALELGRLLLQRSRSGLSDHAMADTNRALALAIQARDGRRTWNGDTTESVVLAVTAAALLGDVDRAWRLTQAEDGEATAQEASAPAVRREAALLASMTGRFDRAVELATDLNDVHVTEMTQALKASLNGDGEAANAAWRRAFESADDDGARLSTAMFLAEAGAPLPDLTELGQRHPEQVREIRVVQEVLATTEDRLAVLRARVHESTRLALELAKHYDQAGQHDKAATVLVDAGHRHREATLVCMGAKQFMRAENYPEAQSAAEGALALGGADWPGEFDARAVLLDSMMGQGDVDGAFAQAQALVALAPDDHNTRWALAYAYMRRGDGEGAWRTLSPGGVPIDPRGRDEAGLWVQLAAEYDNGPRFVPRVLAIVSRWPDDEELQGSAIGRMFFALRKRDKDDPKDVEALRAAADAYEERWPGSQTFRAIRLGPDHDPLAPMAKELSDQATALNPILKQVRNGEMPLGVLTVTGRTYAEAVVRRAGGMVRSYDPSASTAAAAAIATAKDSGAIIDTTAMGTLVTLDKNIRHRLIGALARVETSQGAYRDALRAQAALGMQSTMTVGWDTEAGKISVHETSTDDAQLLATRAAAIAELAATMSRRTRTGPSRFPEDHEPAEWLEAYEISANDNLVFWCDDVLLAAMARNEGIVSFSTIDLLRDVLTRDPTRSADASLLDVAEGILITNYHVELGFNPAAMQFAADLEDWTGRGAAFALSRAAAWSDTEAAGDFLLLALDRHGSNSANGGLRELREWTAAGALGVLRTAPDAQSAQQNVGIVLATIMSRPWIGPEKLAVAVEAVRAAAAERPETDDPLEGVLREFYPRLVQETEPGIAAAVFMSLVRQLPEADRNLAARIVLDAK